MDLKKSIFIFLFAQLFHFHGFSQLGTISDFIKVDQFGYRSTDDKVAVLTDPLTGYNAGQSYTPGNTFQIRSSIDNSLVHSAVIEQWNGGNEHIQSGDKGWWYDFSDLQIVGSYYVYDPTNNLRSFEFDIADDIYAPILEATGRMFYYNRCGMAKEQPHAEANWVDGNNFLQDQEARFIGDINNASTERDVSGGWFDAGDYNKYVNYTNSTLHNLLWAYEQSPHAFTDNWNIPESGNGIPDILDEIKWELDWLLKMVNADGTVHIKVGSTDFGINDAAPPSVNTNPRYYGSTCSSSEITAAGIFAHASSILSEFTAYQSYATNLQIQAENIWAQVLPQLNNNTLDIDCDSEALTASDSDEDVIEQKSNALSSAIYLFALTNDPTYNNYIIANSSDAIPLDSDLWDNYHISEIDALLLYTTLSDANNTLKQTIISAYSAAVNNNWLQYWGWNEEDLYRGYMPDWTYHWGSNINKATFGVLNFVTDYYGYGSSLSLQKRYEETVHYFHGVNPQNMCYLSNMYSLGAEKSANEIYHSWFNDGSIWDNAITDLGPAPGYLVGGPNNSYDANTLLSPPYDQPSLKSYLDFNDGFPNSSWQITEPAIYYQAAYLRLLSTMVPESDPGFELDLKVFLEGPYDISSGLMEDQLRQSGNIPLTEPFTSLGFNHVLGGGETTTSSVLNTTSSNAIVDWIFVELRDGNSPTTIIATQSALMQRDGDIVSTDGITPVTFSAITESSVFVALRHRNHFGIRTSNPYSTSANIDVDFTNISTEIYGTNPTNIIGANQVLVSGDANIDGQINSIDKNIYWRIQNGSAFNYLLSNADFDLNSYINSVDRNVYYRPNNSRVEQLD